jgi:GTP pyrophosphokinase
VGWLDPHLGYVKTSHARGKIRAWFRQQDHERHIRAGKAMLDRERQKLGIRDIDLEELARRFHLARSDELLIALGRADIGPGQLANALVVPETQPSAAVPRLPKTPTGSLTGEDVTIQGVRNLMSHFARCCEPKPQDAIIGYVTLGRGVAIHRQDCSNILRLPPERQGRLIDVGWGAEPDAFAVEIVVRALDRKGLLKDIASILAAEHINIVRTQSLTHPKARSVSMQITAEVASLDQLSRALGRIGAVHNVLEACRREQA